MLTIIMYVCICIIKYFSFKIYITDIPLHLYWNTVFFQEYFELSEGLKKNQWPEMKDMPFPLQWLQTTCDYTHN